MRKGRVFLEIVFITTLSYLLNLVLQNIEVPFYNRQWDKTDFADVEYPEALTIVGIVLMLLILIWEWIQRKNNGGDRHNFEKYLYFIGIVLVFISIVVIGRFFLLDY